MNRKFRFISKRKIHIQINHVHQENNTQSLEENNYKCQSRSSRTLENIQRIITLLLNLGVLISIKAADTAFI